MTLSSRPLAAFTSGVLLTFLGFATEARAQNKAAAESDMKEIAAYRLSMDMVNRVGRAMHAVAATGDATKDADSSMFNDEQSLSDMEKAVKRAPALANALAKENVTPREYAKFTMAMIQASLAAALQKGGGKLPEGVSPENVKFMVDHETEMQQMQQSMWGGGQGN